MTSINPYIYPQTTPVSAAGATTAPSAERTKGVSHARNPLRTRLSSTRLQRRQSRAVGWAGVLCGAVAVGCGGSRDPVSPLPPLTPGAVIGSYALVTVDGHALPVVFGAPGTLISDSLTFAADSTVTDRSAGGLEGSAAVVDTETYVGRSTLSAGSRTVHTTFPGSESSPTTTLDYRVGATADTLRLNARNGGLWVYTRVGR
ncbi:hypothetical protein tb265_12000 [Gemmatimonadetes bacterium T265]|nr:hypothetical protein tb265_12000 [Gemmatimonadetes bacterium T265]